MLKCVRSLLWKLKGVKSINHTICNLDLKHFKLSEFDSPDEPGSGSKMDKKFLEKEKQDTIAHASANLNDRESMVIKNYYGLYDTKQMSLAQIAEMIDLSKERVRQIKDTAITKLRKSLMDKSRYAFG